MATFADIYKQMGGKPFKAFRNTYGDVATFDKQHFKWSDGTAVSAWLITTMDDWTLIPPEPTAEEILREAGYLVCGPYHDSIGRCVHVENGFPSIDIHNSKFPTTPDAARKLVAFLNEYRE